MTCFWNIYRDNFLVKYQVYQEKPLMVQTVGNFPGNSFLMLILKQIYYTTYEHMRRVKILNGNKSFLTRSLYK